MVVGILEKCAAVGMLSNGKQLACLKNPKEAFPCARGRCDVIMFSWKTKLRPSLKLGHDALILFEWSAGGIMQTRISGASARANVWSRFSFFPQL